MIVMEPDFVQRFEAGMCLPVEFGRMIFHCLFPQLRNSLYPLFAALSAEIRYDQFEVTYAKLRPTALPVAHPRLELLSDRGEAYIFMNTGNGWSPLTNAIHSV